MQQVIDSIKGLTLAKGVACVNEWVNRNVKYTPPDDGWNFNRWSSPERTLEKGGNCLDLAVLKMSMLIAAGFSVDDVFISRAEKHAVLTFNYPTRRWCWSKPELVTWVADNNPPYFYQLRKSKLILRHEPPFRWDEVQKYVDFDRGYFKSIDAQ